MDFMGEHFNSLSATEKMAVTRKARRNLAEQIDRDYQEGKSSWAKKHKQQFLENGKEELAENPDAVRQLVEEMRREKAHKGKGRSIG